MADFVNLVETEMFLPVRAYHKAFQSFAKDAVVFLNGIDRDGKLAPEVKVTQLIRAQAAGLLAPMPELVDYTGDGTYVVDSTIDTSLGGSLGVTLAAASLGLNYSRSRQDAEHIAHHVAWKCRAVLPDVDRLRAIVDMQVELTKELVSGSAALPVGTGK